MSELRRQLEQFRSTPQGQGLLRMIRVGEGTSGPQGYQTMFGGGTFDTSKGWRHPDRVVRSGGYASSAAGAYQFLTPTWQSAQRTLGLSSFDPASQDLAALYLAKQRGALDVLQKGGKLVDVMDRIAPEWASIPTREGRSYYGQPVKSVSDLSKAYEEGKAGAPVQTPAGTAQAVQRGNALGQTILQQVLKQLVPATLQKRSQVLSPEELLSISNASVEMPSDYLDLFV